MALGYEKVSSDKRLRKSSQILCHHCEFLYKNVDIWRTIKQRMENMYSRSKSSLFQQDFLSSLPNDLNIHFIHFCRSTFTGGVSVKNSSLYSKRPLPFLTWSREHGLLFRANFNQTPILTLYSLSCSNVLSSKNNE